MKRSVPDWNIKVPTLSREIGVPTGTAHSADPPRTLLRIYGCIPSVFRSQKQAKITQKQHPSAAPGPFSQTGFPRLCSLYVVICVFLQFWIRKNKQITTYSEQIRGSLFG